jgi:hypothetical protein
MTTKHTEGPWVAIEGDTFHRDRPWGVSKYLTLAECEEIDGDEAEEESRTIVLAEVTDGETAEADAKLMAAAPELLEALAECVKVYEAHRDDQPTGHLWPDPNHIHHARRAIAKAAGELVKV